MAESFARTARRFFSPEALVPFLFGSIALGVLSNAAFTLCTNLLGLENWPVLGIAVGSLAILALAVWVVTRLVRPLPESTALPGKRSPSKRRGLVLLVSKKPPCEKAISFHDSTLERVWLICSAQSLSVAKELQTENAWLVLSDPFIVNDVNDPLEFYTIVEKVYASLPEGWWGEDVITDYVGMTAHGSVGVVLACFGSNRPLQYTPAKYDENLKPVGPLDPIEITFDGLK